MSAERRSIKAPKPQTEQRESHPQDAYETKKTSQRNIPNQQSNKRVTSGKSGKTRCCSAVQLNHRAVVPLVASS